MLRDLEYQQVPVADQSLMSIAGWERENSVEIAVSDRAITSVQILKIYFAILEKVPNIFQHILGAVVIDR
jgi:hypothetical protein